MGRYRDLTIRLEPCDPRYGRDVAIHLYKKRIVVYMPTRDHAWRRGKLTAVLPAEDRFRVTWSNGMHSNLKGLWRIHHACLFTRGRLPVPVRSARIQKGKNHYNPGGLNGKMATKRAVKKSAKKAASSNGDGLKLGDLSVSERKKMAAQIKMMRKNKEPWDGDDGICAQLGLSSALQGRNLLREFGGENLIREREGNGSSAPAKTVKKPAAKPAAKRRVNVKRGKGRSTNPS